MKITVVRSGGFAGLTRSWVVVVDRHDQHWASLLDDLPWGSVKLVVPTPDRFVYRIRVSRRQVVLPEQQVAGAWRTLVDQVISEAERACEAERDSGAQRDGEAQRDDSADPVSPEGEPGRR